MVNRQLYTYKFVSGKLKACNYNITTTFDEAHAFGQVVAQADSQMFRLIRRLRKRTIDRNKVERLYAERDILRRRCEKRKHNKAYAERLKVVRDKINRTMFMPDYVTVVMEHKSHYKRMFEQGFVINGVTYKRLSCSAGQARVSTVVFCAEDLIPELKQIINNNRDQEKKIAPSKYNAYFGLNTSATFLVTEPRVCVVPDCNEPMKFMAAFDTETDWAMDDIIEQREVQTMMNRADGQGLISPAFAKIWANDLGLDYVPSTFIIRHNFLKGMVGVFDFMDFCEKVNGGNTIIDTVYKDVDGNPIKADLRNVDVIVTESQFKLWDSWPSWDKYLQDYHSNGLQWGVASYAPKVLKDIVTMNYQFLQTLDLNKRSAEDICSLFVDWVKGVTFQDRAYMLLFLMGVNNTQESIEWFIKCSDNWWIKALAVNPQCANDPFIRGKIRDLLRKKINGACMGEIILNGNFQTGIADPYAMMQHVCGLEATGLMKAGWCYSKYWIDKNVKVIDLMRSPMTYRCEHVVDQLEYSEQASYWYQYLGTTMVMNWHDNACVRLGGCDFDRLETLSK